MSNENQGQAMDQALEALKGGDEQAAAAVLREAYGFEDGDPRIHHMIGALYAQLGQLEGAVRHMRQALAIAPQFPIARFQLGLMLVTAGYVIDALEAWGPLDQLPREDALFCFKSGLVHFVKDEFEPARQWLRAGIARNEINPALNRDMEHVLTLVDEAESRFKAAADTPEAAAQAA